MSPLFLNIGQIVPSYHAEGITPESNTKLNMVSLIYFTVSEIDTVTKFR